MSTQKHRKVVDWRKVMDTVYASLSNGTISKLFEDDYFVFELIKLLYEETIEVHVRVEILMVIEEWGSEVLPKNSFDQAISALLDVFRDMDATQSSVTVASQLLITVTTLFIANEELMDTDLCLTYMTHLISLVNKVNINNRRLRACGCQCLAQLESWKPGLLWRWRETFAKLVREEKTDVCQDYMLLLITVALDTDQLEKEEQKSLKSEIGKKAGGGLSTARENKDVLSTVSLIMDNLFPLTPSGLLAVVCSVVRLVQRHQDILPNVFKPLMLQCLPSMNPYVIFMMLYLQKQFGRLILSESEENLLLRRAVECVNHPISTTNSRLVILEWLLSYLQEEKLLYQLVPLKKILFPVVFDPLDVHVRKLSLLAHCSDLDTKKDLVSDLHYLTQVSMTTGGMRVATALYHILYLHVKVNSSELVHEQVLRITRKLFENFPHLIPLIVDFLRAVKACEPHFKFHHEILTLLHETVLSQPLSSLLSNYHNFLHVWILSAQESSIPQQKPLRRLLELVQEAVVTAVDDWNLGCVVLNICRTMMLHHHTDILYCQMGDLLSFLKKEFGDMDIQDEARIFYSILTLFSDTKVKEILGARAIESLHLGDSIAEFFPKSITQTAPAEIHLLNTCPVVWSREHLEIVFEKRSEKNDCSFPEPVRDGLEDYWAQVLCIQTFLKCTLKASVSCESDFDNLVAISFHSEENNNIKLSQDLCLPYLSKAASSTLCFDLKPEVPQPMLITARAVFCSNRATYQCELSPLKFSLQDFLIPFPWHLFDISDRRTFFNTLWSNYTARSHDKSQGVESVKILKFGRWKLLDVWRAALISVGEQQDTDDFLFFLPQRFHLLFRVQAQASNLVLHIATDYWPILADLDEFLDSLS